MTEKGILFLLGLFGIWLPVALIIRGGVIGKIQKIEFLLDQLAKKIDKMERKK